MRSIYTTLILCSAVLFGSNNDSFAQSTTFAYSGAIVTYTVPAGVTSLNITATGAAGGGYLAPTFFGGDGAIINGTVAVVPGHILNILVGGIGGISPSCAGGGGGTFVWDASATTPLIVAGGGGGATSTEDGIAASLTINGTDGGGGATYGGAGTGGSGSTPPTGITSVSGYGAGGCGWLSNGTNGNPGSPIIAGTTTAQGGKSPNPGISPGTGAGGTEGGTPTAPGGAGGFGGGGGGQVTGAGITTASGGGAGGGGGYSGGGCGVSTPVKGGGGGGSYCASTILTSSATNTGSGQVVITILCGPGAISGNAPLCVGATEPLTDTPSGGTWVSTNTAIATIDGSGNVTGLTPGTDTIFYIVLSDCGVIDTASAPLIVVGSSAGTITGTPMVCVGTTTTLSDATSGGSWSASNTNAGVSSGGVVTGSIAGLVTIYYTNSCSLASTSVVVTVNPTPSAGTITGATYTVCVGSSISLTDGATGGSWSSSSTTVATVAGGTVYGASAGTSTISYTVIGACATFTATHVITVNPIPVAGTISGTTVCVGATVTMTDVGGGIVGTGMWTSSNTLVATTSLAIGSSTTVTGVSPGTTTITYTVSNSCGVATATAVVTVNAAPVAGTIIGTTSTVCSGASITLTDAATGGTWSATNTDATIAGGIVTGAAAGLDTIDYTVSNSCGTTVATYPITVNAAPSAGTISGPATVCVGSPTITLTDAATGGTWSASNGNATVVGGVVTGVTAGTDNIIYTVTNACGSNTATQAITISTAPTAGTITGTDSVCIGHPVTLTDGTTGGVWSCSNTKATISGDVVTGATAGMDTVIYTVTNACGSATAVFHIKVKSCPSEVNPIAAGQELVIFPNPANEELTIKMDEGAFSSFTITNSVGQVLIEQTLNAAQTIVNIKALPSSAIYYITFRGQDGTSVQRFIKM